MARSRPYVILSAAMSIDGKIATRKGASKLSSDKDLDRLHKLRAGVDAILVGKNTVVEDDPSLTVRRVRGKNPARIVVDPKASIPSSSKVVKTSKQIPTILAVSDKAPASRTSVLARSGVRVVSFGRSKVSLRKLLSYLARIGIKKLLVEGGGTTNWHFLNENLVDEILVTIAPFIIGGQGAVSLVEGDGFDSIARSFRLRSVRKMGDELLLRYVR
ncbi:MAG TPA: 2,5-diamino-6-(ribosylamino)-4(3H)-pyrimidinone 5'-phosphate reductase [Candidatus Nitrosotalea sp.]|nr:2,5-diamino-6-(ribosylamino)-4(3H)-pyrimidinone 5'-phosphate reductase [Candidatus Nitrosotalea sp.]